MSDIFISYSHQDRDRARELAERLKQEGWSVFWDRVTPVGKVWSDILDEELNNTKVIIVLWSRYSVKSNFVRDEAQEGAERNILAPAFIDIVKIPLGFRALQTADISGWKLGNPDTEGMLLLIEAVKSIGKLKSFQKDRIIATSKKVTPSKPSNDNTVIDIDGNKYRTVKIGNQVWMAENLKTTKFNDGTIIPMVTEAASWGKLKTPGFCWYDNDKEKYKDVCGALYNWRAVKTGKLCPKGWHIPCDAEWEQLAQYISDIKGPNFKKDNCWYSVGGHLKSANGWHKIGNGTDDFGFKGLPGGSRASIGSFINIGTTGEWWSFMEKSTSDPWIWRLHDDTIDRYRVMQSVSTAGFSVRCLRD